jgi:hypothetical protein
LPGGRVKVIVRIDHTALVRGHTEPGEQCDIPGFGPVPVAAARELIDSGDAFVAAVVTRGVDVMTVAHLGRKPTAHQQTALELRDARCCISGCGNTFCETDHNTGWVVTRDTRTGDLSWLCHFHHRQKTAGWQLIGTGTDRELVPPSKGAAA